MPTLKRVQRFTQSVRDLDIGALFRAMPSPSAMGNVVRIWSAKKNSVSPSASMAILQTRRGSSKANHFSLLSVGLPGAVFPRKSARDR